DITVQCTSFKFSESGKGQKEKRNQCRARVSTSPESCRLVAAQQTLMVSWTNFRSSWPPFTSPPPRPPGGNRFVNTETGTVDRYGVTKDLSRRYGEHRRSGCFDPDKHRFVWQPARDGITSTGLYADEVKKIKKHKPCLNMRNGGAGPRW